MPRPEEREGETRRVAEAPKEPRNVGVEERKEERSHACYCIDVSGRLFFPAALKGDGDHWDGGSISAKAITPFV
jgi:hypothetical protein